MRRGLLVAVGLAAAFTGQAVAGPGYGDRVYADSYGNLVIHMAAGPKRILVGQGHRAAEIGGYRYEGTAVFYEESGAYEIVAEPRVVHRCSRAPVVLHGRSYMYGLPENVIPVPDRICP